MENNMKKIGDTFFHGNLEYVVDEVNEDGTCNAHLIKVHKDAPTTPTESPVKAVEDAEPIKVSDKPKRTYTRSNTTTRTRKTTTK